MVVIVRGLREDPTESLAVETFNQSVTHGHHLCASQTLSHTLTLHWHFILLTEHVEYNYSKGWELASDFVMANGGGPLCVKPNGL